MSRPTSPYLLFLKQNNSQQLSLKDRAALWQALTPQEKEVYVNKFNDLRRQYQANKGNEMDEIQGKEKKEKEEGRKEYLFPLAKVKTIAKAQGEIGQIRHDALIQLSKATQFFLQDITKDMVKHSDKKRLTAEDLFDCFQRNQQYWFLRSVIAKQKKDLPSKQPKDKEKEKEKQQLQGENPLAGEKQAIRGALDMFFSKKD